MINFIFFDQSENNMINFMILIIASQEYFTITIMIIIY